MLKGFTGKLFDFDEKAGVADLENAFRYFDDGLLVTKDGIVQDVGNYRDLIGKYHSDIEISDHKDCFIFPGFIDAHIHSVQTKAIASHGNQLLEWLETYVFPAEKKFISPEYALTHTQVFFDELLKNGTTTALIYPSVHDASVEAVFTIAQQLNMRIISGKTWMDRNAPAYLLEPPQKSHESSKKQIERWHGKGRSHYAVTPRYAITSTPESLKIAGELLTEYDGLYVQTHISENKKEIETVNQHYNRHRGYLDVYDSFGLLNPRTLLGHGIHLTGDELDRIAQAGASVVHCPTSNLFLGSGLFDFRKTLDHGVQIAIGSDMGGGTSFSMLRNLHDAYKISALVANNNQQDAVSEKFTAMNPFQAIYFITLGGARALKLNDRIGNFGEGKEADFVVINPSKNTLLNYRLQDAASLEEILFAIVMLGDEQIVEATYLMGKKVYQG
jgi:guanine deaminase